MAVTHKHGEARNRIKSKPPLKLTNRKHVHKYVLDCKTSQVFLNYQTDGGLGKGGFQLMVCWGEIPEA